MKPRRAPMRRTPLASGTPIERKTPIRAKPNGPVKARRVTPTERSGRRLVRVRSGGRCERCGTRRAAEWHHRRNRSQGGDWSAANGVHLCTPCHVWITEHPAACYVLGWLVPHGATPEQWPVLRMGSWQQPGETWELAEPHPRQIQLGEAS